MRYPPEGTTKRPKKSVVIAALAFLPVHHVEAGFETLDDANLLPAELQGIVDYFEETWIGLPTRRGKRRAPAFPLVMRNYFEEIVAGLPGTTNAVEGWHRAFETM